MKPITVIFNLNGIIAAEIDLEEHRLTNSMKNLDLATHFMLVVEFYLGIK
jgi:hypothetical protein